MMKCQRCSLPIFDGVCGYAGPQCKCWTHYAPSARLTGAEPAGCLPAAPLTEQDVRRIVRDEVQRAMLDFFDSSVIPHKPAQPAG